MKLATGIISSAWRWLLIVLIFIVTFPVFYADYGMGLDNSYVWGLNWLFAHDFDTLRQLIYPYGPLGFLKLTTAEGHNLLWAVLFYSTLKLLFIKLLMQVVEIINSPLQWAQVLIILMVSYIINIDFLIIGNCLILNFLFQKNPKLLFFIISVLIAFTGLFIKSSIGISCLSIIFLSVLIHLISTKNISKLLKLLMIVLGIGVFTGWVILGHLSTYFHFLMGIVTITGGYGDTLALHPDNNWFYLCIFIILTISFPFIYKNKDANTIYLLSPFLLLAAWKHSFIREDISHYKIIITFLIVFWGIVLLVIKSKKNTILIIPIVTVLALYGNMRNIPSYKGINVELAGINNFLDILHYKDYKESQSQISQQQIVNRILDTETRQLIADKTIDIYPWEHVYAAANGLNWKPRTTIEIGASTSWASSKKAAKHYLMSANSPEFVLFHLQNDVYGGKLGSIDGRYLLNDEPEVIFNLLNNYSLCRKNEQFLLFKKAAKPHFEILLQKQQNVQFNEWIDVKGTDQEVVRLKVQSKNTYLGILQKLVYKGEEYYIDYLFEDGNILTYRYVKSTAVGGIWCNPFIRFPNSDVGEQKVLKVRLRNSNSLAVSNQLQVQIQRIKLKKEIDNEQQRSMRDFLFSQNEQVDRKRIQTLLQTFEELPVVISKSYEVTTSTLLPEQRINKVSGNSYSYTYVLNLDSLWGCTKADTLLVEGNAKVLNYYSQGGFIISGEGTDNDFWEIQYLLQSIQKHLWHYAYISKYLYRSQHAHGILKIYILNSGNSPIYMDDLRVLIKN